MNKEVIFEHWREIITKGGLDHPTDEELLLGAFSIIKEWDEHQSFESLKDGLRESLHEFFNP